MIMGEKIDFARNCGLQDGASLRRNNVGFWVEAELDVVVEVAV
jgi:hypothetical protein